MILVIDNYDSFTFNLVQLLEMAGAGVRVERNDVLGPDDLEALTVEGLSGILISPGPGRPETAGVSIEAVLLAARRELPLLGVCLGHQCLGAAFGADVVRAPSLVHGQASAVSHDGQGLLAGLPSPFEAARYHSLCLTDALPPDLEVTARSDDGVVMAIRHRVLPLEGVQFHPESVLTPEGPRLLANFLRRTGDGDPGRLVDDPPWRTSALPAPVAAPVADPLAASAGAVR
ncbi:MAG TPA: aminodeoxychorismate/anthranilate synthase component II [Candidatus Limnocylindrales bacterium]|nr:aminodeoxychorismate/anthranilate synthase component II [Candidatus Limnocylindrales bacterium]